MTVEDPCSYANIVTTPNEITDFDVRLPYTGIQTQSFTITTDVEIAHPGVTCDFVTSMSPGNAFTSYDPLTRTVTVTESGAILPNDIGEFPFTVYVNSLQYSATVPEKQMNFDVNIICDVTSFPLTERPLDTEYVLYQGTYVTESFQVTQDEACKLPETVIHTFTQNGLTVPHPPEIVFDPVTRVYTINAEDRSMIGTWDI